MMLQPDLYEIKYLTIRHNLINNMMLSRVARRVEDVSSGQIDRFELSKPVFNFLKISNCLVDFC